MKNFVAFQSADHKKGVHSFYVYGISRNHLVFVGSGEIKWGLTKGGEDEVMKVLAGKGLVAKKWLDTFDYYYSQNKVKIQYIIPKKLK